MLTVKNLQVNNLKSISLSLAKGECLSLCGASGSGKTTILNAIAGYLPYRGQITLAGHSLDSLPAWKRQIRYLNQRLYLFPHFSLIGNLLLAQYASSQQMNKNQCLQMLERFNLQHLANRRPAQISGGEQQRAALARAMIGSPKLLLLDEPFSSLDWVLRKQLWQHLIDLRQKNKLPIILVTHEPEEADHLTDRTLYLANGQIT